MNRIFTQQNLYCSAFRIEQVIFDDGDLVSVNCTARLHETLSKTTLLFTFSVFNDFLRLSGESGSTLQQEVCNKLLGNEQPPYLISFHESPLLFINCILTLSQVVDGDETCYSVEGIQPLSFLQQALQLKHNIRDFGDVHLSPKNWLQNSFRDLASVYRYYTGLLELNVNDFSARSKAGLTNQKIFKLAYYAAQQTAGE